MVKIQSCIRRTFRPKRSILLIVMEFPFTSLAPVFLYFCFQNYHFILSDFKNYSIFFQSYLPLTKYKKAPSGSLIRALGDSVVRHIIPFKSISLSENISGGVGGGLRIFLHNRTLQSQPRFHGILKRIPPVKGIINIRSHI